MSTLNDPRVKSIPYGYRVDNPELGPVRVYQQQSGHWASFFDTSTPAALRPEYGIPGSACDTADEAVGFALRAEQVTT